MKNLVLFSLLALIAAPALAEPLQGKEGGGGDPLANQFLKIGRFMAETYSRKEIPDLGVSAEQLNLRLDKIEASLEGHSPLVTFPQGETVDCFGAPKLGCVVDGHIYIARDGWLVATITARVEVTAMELLLSLNSLDRYGKAAEIAKIIGPRLTIDREGLIQPIPQTTTPLRECNFETMKPAFEQGMRKYVEKVMTDKRIDYLPGSFEFEYLGKKKITFFDFQGEQEENAVSVTFRTKNGSLIALGTPVEAQPADGMDYVYGKRHMPFPYILLLVPEPKMREYRNSEGFVFEKSCVASFHSGFNRYLLMFNSSLKNYVVSDDLVSSKGDIASQDLE